MWWMLLNGIWEWLTRQQYVEKICDRLSWIYQSWIAFPLENMNYISQSPLWQGEVMWLSFVQLMLEEETCTASRLCPLTMVLHFPLPISQSGADDQEQSFELLGVGGATSCKEPGSLNDSVGHRPLSPCCLLNFMWVWNKHVLCEVAERLGLFVTAVSLPA